jgi:ABC-type nitrate/sulfonate/bicarbonate transport system permease component
VASQDKSAPAFGAEGRVRAETAPAVGASWLGSARRLRPIVVGAISLATVTALWHLSTIYIFNPVLVPTPFATFREAAAMIESGELFVHVGISLKRILMGFVTGSVVGIVIGTLIGHFRLLREFADPVIELIRPISPVALVPVAILWFGIEELSRYFIIFYATVLVVMLNTAAGVSVQPVTRLRAAKSLGADNRQIFLHVVLPSAVPHILTGMRIAIGFSFMGVVAAEMIGASTGIGYLIMQSRLMILPERMFVGLVSLSIVGLITDRIFRWLLDWSTKRFTQYQAKV